MPMPFEKLRLENPTEEDITEFSYEGRENPQGLEAPEFDEVLATAANPFHAHMFIDSLPVKQPGNRPYEDIRNIRIVGLTVEGKTLGPWVLSAGDGPSCIREVIVVVRMVRDNPAPAPDLYQATATVWYRDEAGEETYFEYYSAPF